MVSFLISAVLRDTRERRKRRNIKSKGIFAIFWKNGWRLRRPVEVCKEAKERERGVQKYKKLLVVDENAIGISDLVVCLWLWS